ncbi:hypothetical protein K502DRAFT_323215 [Neoconidiobolus thromboides FSU 785]|nr:hypothetical protein K502DRAFT_323215 [Neoconidiobolus thromboides FSU 785]
MADYTNKKDSAKQSNFGVKSSSTSNQLYNNRNTKPRYPTNQNEYTEQGSGVYNRDEGYNRLTQKVSLLKQISLDMGEEIIEGNKDLGGMHEDLSETGEKLKRTMEKFSKMAKEQFKGGGIYLWIVLFILFILFLMIIFR